LKKIFVEYEALEFGETRHMKERNELEGRKGLHIPAFVWSLRELFVYSIAFA